MDEEISNPQARPYQVGAALGDMSLDELAKTIKILQAEILRLEKEINKKQTSLKDADGAFKF